MADSGTSILNLPLTATLLDTDVLPLGRPSGTTAPGTNVGMTGADLKRLSPNGNSLFGTDKRVRFLTAAQLAASTDGGDCLDALDPATLVLGGLAWVEFHPAGYGTTLRLLYDGAPRTPAGSGLTAYRTGDRAYNDTVPVRWMLATAPDASVAAYPQKPAGYVFAVSELVRAYVPDSPTEQFFAALYATALPAPTASAGDANWRAVAGSAVPGPVGTVTPQASNLALGTVRGNGFPGAIGNVSINTDGTMTAGAAPSGPSGPGGLSGGGGTPSVMAPIDYSNPIVISGATDLQPNHCYNAGGAGGTTLALPLPAPVGAQIFIFIDPNQSDGLFPVTNTEPRLPPTFMQPSETALFLYGPYAWRRIGGVPLRNSLLRGLPVSFPTDFQPGTTTIAFNRTIGLSGQMGFTRQGAILIQRPAEGAVEATIALEKLTAGGYYEVSLIQTKASGEVLTLASSLVPTAALTPDNVTGKVALSARCTVREGDQLTVSIYANAAGSTLNETTIQTNHSTFIFTEN